MAKSEKAILIGVNLNNQEEDFAYSMQELYGLAAACNLEVAGAITQNLQRINKTHYIGTGKLQEVIDLLESTAADVVIFNDELSPSQIRELEERLNKQVIDRTMLILDIFAERAKTREAKLQVEIARLQYMLPRLVGQRDSLGRQGGGAGLKNRGAGETKLELDRRVIKEKITILTKELETLVAQRETQRKKRKKNDLPVVSLVGYTNAGKSTIMNAMVEMFNQNINKQVFEKDMLFATLETSVRKIKLSDNKSFLLTDTVGFINKLPHHLVKAFRSTLEELAEADVIIHVVDYSEPQHKKLIEVTNQTLQEIGVEDIPIIYAYNKGDLTATQLPRIEGDIVYLSAKKRVGINELIHVISKNIFADYMQCELLIPYDQGQIISYFNEHAHVYATTYEPGGTKILVECKHRDYKKFQDYACKLN
ncbi:GTPase HflX [Sporotomaculum syntrophicum]|uniref:GTPase HflX n=1 Tax=Sporotomaculum syntrophicum TaxID=182264 RepID=A0A9D2WQ35_9FIRM|nr:GTPase HflX [Sporotomaculum syntrophicum]KAF1085500.1 GTPase HflX [Sporotomaculum syntrophicum]